MMEEESEVNYFGGYKGNGKKGRSGYKGKGKENGKGIGTKGRLKFGAEDAEEQDTQQIVVTQPSTTTT